MARKHKLPPGTWIEREMMTSEAFNALSGWAPQLLVLILSKRRFEKSGRKGKEQLTCVNRDLITFTYIEAEKRYSITKPRFRRAIDDLLAKGFIHVVHQGGAFKQDKTIYGLSDHWGLWKHGMIFETRQPYVERGYRN